MTERRQHTRRAEDRPARPGRMPVRRRPGTAALAATNLIAATIALDPTSWTTIIALRYMGGDRTGVLWAGLFAASGLLLFAACVWRRWWQLNVGGVISLFVWTVVSVSIILVWASNGGSRISPIAVAMAWWMPAGQATMLMTPLMGRTRGVA